MSLSRSLNTGTSSLQANQQGFDVISNNIANVGTYGYKSSRTNFAEQFSQTYSYGKSPDNTGGVGVGGVNPYQVGLGVYVGSTTYNMNQGTPETTNRPLDMMINGDGYFIYNNNGQDLYSRAGAISKDEDGNLTDSNTGAFLQGYNVKTDANGRIVKDSNGDTVIDRTKKNLTVSPNTISPPSQTSNVTLSGNLNYGDATGAERQTSIDIYDNLGNSHTLNFTFTKSATASEYTLKAQIDGKDLTLANSTVKFNATDGTLETPTSITFKASDLNTAVGSKGFDESNNKTLNVQLGKSGTSLTGLTQYKGPNTATATEQDGYSSGTLNDISVDDEGKIWGSFSNNKSEVLGQVIIAKFSNPAGLTHVGSNFLTPSPNSGLPNIGSPGETFPSTKIKSNTLEMSNADLTTEFTSMITAQRSYEAAARIITTSDTLLETTLSLKR
jgi:flagellar hook protein FlgE